MAPASNAGYLIDVGPYRDAVAVERVVAEITGGRLELEIAPEHLTLAADGRRVVVAGKRLVVTRKGRRREIRREHALDHARLHLARGFPGRELALWLEATPGVVERVWGVEPRSLLDDGGLDAGRALDRLVTRLRDALGERGGAATELGEGGHRVLLADRRDRLVVYARPLFRERPRRVLEVCADGTLAIPAKGGDRRARFRSRYDVIASGDHIRFAGERGDDVAHLFLPWIAPEDRAELARRFAELVDPAPPDETGHAIVRAPARGPLSARLAAAWPLPLSSRAR